MLSFPFGRVVLSRSRVGEFPLRVAVPIVAHCWGATACRVGVLSLWFVSFVSLLLCFVFCPAVVAVDVRPAANCLRTLYGSTRR